MSERVPPIRSELLAAKIEKLRNFELPDLFDEFSAEPRFIGALWFLEYVSKPDNYAGGLTKFAEEFASACAERIGTPTMLKVGAAAAYKPNEAVAIFKELREPARSEIFGADTWILDNAFFCDETPRTNRINVQRHENFWDEDSPKITWKGTRRRVLSVLVAKLTPAAARDVCLKHVTERLATYLKAVCEMPHVGLLPSESKDGAPEYFSQVGATLLSFIDQRANTLRASLAETEVTRLVFRWMSKAREMNEPVMISGNARFGKTETVKLLCDMQPGDFRLVNTPASNAIGDLFREVARSLGIEVGAQNNLRELRERVEFVLRFSRLVLCFDEFQFVLPANYSRNTAPARLNWLRRAIVDQKLPAVFICTPQSYLPAKKRFLKTTGFAIEQFDERILKTVHLPNELSEADLLAVARIHFSDLTEEYLQLVVEAALATERNYVSDVSKIAKLAKDNARENSRQRPLLCDIEAAIADVLPTRPTRATALLTTRKRPPIAAPIPTPCKAPASPLQTARISSATLPESRRGMIPLAVKT